MGILLFPLTRESTVYNYGLTGNEPSRRGEQEQDDGYDILDLSKPAQWCASN